MAEDLGEKTEAPTGKRLSEARDRGQVPKSQDLIAVIVMSGAVTAIAVLGPSIFHATTNAMRVALSPDSLMSGVWSREWRTAPTLIAREMLVHSIPMFVVMMIVGAIAHLVQTGPVLAGRALKPDLNRLNPINGAKKLFGKRMLVKTGMDLGKLVLVIASAAMVIRHELPTVLSLMGFGLEAAVVEAAMVVVRVSAVVLLALLVLALLDLIYQRMQHTEDLKMTKQQVKDERKSTDGDPQTKARQMRIARQIALQRLGQDVPGADVVVANPTHFSVALRYDPETMGAPVVVAKGADYLALKIRYIATAHSVPIVERPPLARALYREVQPGQQVPHHHFEAVAEVLAYVYRLDGRAASMTEPKPAAAASAGAGVE
ncbi:MAG: flagellar biosynthesis protein FlhB [Phycisphaerales bacterium]